MKDEENHYRYYFVWQMDTFEVIRALQKLGMPLGEIRAYMETRSPEHFSGAGGSEGRRKLDQEIERLKKYEAFYGVGANDHQGRRWRPRWISRCWRKEDRNICFLPR